MPTIRARACIKCEKYLLIIPNDPINEEYLKKFEKNHRKHTIITVDESEVKGKYKNIEYDKEE